MTEKTLVDVQYDLAVAEREHGAEIAARVGHAA